MTSQVEGSTIPDEWINPWGKFVTHEETIKIRTMEDVQYVKYRLERLHDLFQNEKYLVNLLYLQCYCDKHRMFWSRRMK